MAFWWCFSTIFLAILFDQCVAQKLFIVMSRSDIREFDSADLLNEVKLQSGAIFPIEQWNAQPPMSTKLIILDSKKVGANDDDIRNNLAKYWRFNLGFEAAKREVQDNLRYIYMICANAPQLKRDSQLWVNIEAAIKSCLSAGAKDAMRTENWSTISFYDYVWSLSPDANVILVGDNYLMSTNDNRLNSEKALRLLKYKYEFPSQEGANNVKIVLRKLELDSKSYAAFVAPTGKFADLIRELGEFKKAYGVHVIFMVFSSEKADLINVDDIKSAIEWENPITDIESFGNKDELEEALDFISTKYRPYGVKLEQMEIAAE